MSARDFNEKEKTDHVKNRYGSVDYPHNIIVMVQSIEQPDILPHWHIDAEIMYVMEGAVKTQINGDQRRLEPGDLSISGSYWLHSYRSLLPGTRCLFLNFRPEALGYSSKPWPNQTNGSILSFVSGKQHGNSIERIHRDMDEIREEFSHIDAFSNKFIISRLLDLIWVASKEFYVASDPDVNKDLLGKSMIQRLFDRDVIRYVDSSCTTPLRIKDIALRFGMSQSAISLLFIRETGRNFSQFIREKRVEYAKHLLSEKHMNIAQIAYQCGFESLVTFNRTFKALTGITPREYQRLNDINNTMGI